MVNLLDALLVLAPDATYGPAGTVELSDDGTGPRITRWALAGEPPTAEQLANVTDQQVDAARIEAMRRDAGKVIKASRDAVPVAARAADNALWMCLNTVTEYGRAVLGLLFEAAGRPYPTQQEIVAAITTLRLTVPAPDGAPEPAVVAALGGRRLGEADIVGDDVHPGLIPRTLAAGGGDPFTG